MKNPASLKVEVMEEGELLPFQNSSGAAAELFCPSQGHLLQLRFECLFAGEIWPYPLASYLEQLGVLVAFSSWSSGEAVHHHHHHLLLLSTLLSLHSDSPGSLFN